MLLKRECGLEKMQIGRTVPLRLSGHRGPSVLWEHHSHITLNYAKETILHQKLPDHRNFVWNGKIRKIKSDTVIGPKEKNGGLHLPEYETVSKSLQCA